MKSLAKIWSILLFIFSPYIWAQDAEFIWAEDDQSGSRIFLSEHKNGSWQPAEKIIEDSNLNILPTIGSDTKGQRLAVWSMVDGTNSVLKYSKKRGNRWTEPRVLSDEFKTNLAPVIVFDNNNICWVFWSANDGADDDIYVSKLVRGVWSRPEMVNEGNNTPDILPEAGQDENGNIWVSWQQLQQQGYVDLSRSYSTASLTRMLASQTFNLQSIKQLKLRSNLENTIQPPDGFKGRSRAMMYFPNDKERPSKSVQGKFQQ